jgi:hypothetical protein
MVYAKRDVTLEIAPQSGYVRRSVDLDLSVLCSSASPLYFVLIESGPNLQTPSSVDKYARDRHYMFRRIQAERIALPYVDHTCNDLSHYLGALRDVFTIGYVVSDEASEALDKLNADPICRSKPSARRPLPDIEKEWVQSRISEQAVNARLFAQPKNEQTIIPVGKPEQLTAKQKNCISRAMRSGLSDEVQSCLKAKPARP